MPDSEPTPYSFDLDGGRGCLDFANTLSSSSGDHLATYGDLLGFATQANLLTPEAAGRLRAAAELDPSAAAAILAQGKELRTALRAIFMAVADGERAPDTELEVLNRYLATSLPHARIVAGATPADGYGWAWGSPAELAAPLWPIVRSAADVLTSDQERALVRECGASDCRWLFIDATKNHSRQWCSMGSCGNREKARRHYQRVKAARNAATDEDRGADAPRGRRQGRRTGAAPAGDASATAD